LKSRLGVTHPANLWKSADPRPSFAGDNII